MASLHITVGYKSGAPTVLYCGHDANAGLQAYEKDTECDRYVIVRHANGIRKGPKSAPKLPAIPAATPAPEAEADEAETPDKPRRGRPPKPKDETEE